MQTTATIPLVYEEIINKMKAINKACEKKKEFSRFPISEQAIQQYKQSAIPQ
jgi:hypothetical protein